MKGNMKSLIPVWRNWIIELIAFPICHRILKEYPNNEHKIESIIGLIAQNMHTKEYAY